MMQGLSCLIATYIMLCNKLKILVVDDNEENKSLLKLLIKGMGHISIVASNGLEAIEIFQEESPDLILMDVMMPVMDGYQATKKIREISNNHWVPIIFLSANIELEQQLKGIESGGDDYLPKPINIKLLKVKISAMQRIANMQSQLNKYRAEAESEMELAKKLAAKMTRNHGISDPALKYWLEPASQLSGDLICARRTIDDKLYVMVADATGHGLSAAMSQLPVAQCFYDRSATGSSISGIVAEMNTRLESLLTVDRYVTATLASIDFNNRVIEVWNGSCPDAYFVNQRGEILHRFSSQECPMGIVGNGDYNIQTEIVQWHEAGELVIYSDGLLDAVNKNGESFGEDRLDELFKSRRQENWFSNIKSKVNEYSAGGVNFDDISLVSVDCTIGQVSLKVANG